MSELPWFENLIARVRAGDQEAAAELVRHYEPTIRRVIRFRLIDTRLRNVLDSMDICQSVMASFFLRAATGQFDLSQPDDLVKLLVRMARNKLASQARREQAECRDNRRVLAGGLDESKLADSQLSPSEQVSRKELLNEIQRRLRDDEQQLVDLRQQGLDWETIAQQLNENAVVLRKRLSRALDRISRELGLDELPDESA